jgi:hypothetical protein
MFPGSVPGPVPGPVMMDTIYENENDNDNDNDNENLTVESSVLFTRCGERERGSGSVCHPRQGPPQPHTHTVALGAHALGCHREGRSNVAVGVNALAYGDGDYNVALGTSALLHETQPRLNTVMGSNAMQGHGGGASSSAKNVAVGVQALYDYKHAERNTAVGAYALLKLQEGDDNTCVGFQVGGALVQGHGNTLVGSGADVAHDGISDSTALGKGAVATESHQVVLGTDQETVTVPGSLVVEGYYTPYTRVQSLSWDATGRVTMDVHALYAVNHVPAPTCGEAELVLPSTTYTRPGDWLVLYVVPPRGSQEDGGGFGAIRVMDSYGTELVVLPAGSAGTRLTLPLSNTCRLVYLPGIQPGTPWIVLC